MVKRNVNIKKRTKQSVSTKKNQPEVKKNPSLKTSYLIVSFDEAEQRLDNYLITKLKGVPKSHLYRRIRKGEVRVNMKRISPFYRLKENDKIRIPPLLLNEAGKMSPPNAATISKLKDRILYKDPYLLLINKPAGMSVHAGKTVRIGIVEALRHIYPTLPQLELAHRLDRDTSGCLILAKKRRILRELHQLLREGKIKKIYWALTKGKWKESECDVSLPLERQYEVNGKYLVKVKTEGKSAYTHFKPIKNFPGASLMEAHLLTGRTHQIRVHASSQGHPIAGDDRYGDVEFNRLLREKGVKRMFLHARSIDFTLPSLEQRITVIAPLDSDLAESLEAFSSSDHHE